MRIVGIEPTPNPNSMKLMMDQALPPGSTYHFTAENAIGAPPHLVRMLAVPGVRSVYQVADFIALERSPRADWQSVLSGVRAALAAEGEETGPGGVRAEVQAGEETAFGEVRVFVQTLRGIPMQVKAVAGLEEVRAALPPRFKAAAGRVAEAAADLLAERRWRDEGARYGEVREVAEAAAEEVASAHDDARLAALVERALKPGTWEAGGSLSPDEVAEALKETDWRRRYAALDQLEPDEDGLSVIVTALGDPHHAVRRLATVYLGAVGAEQVLEYLFRALKDPVAAVRRAAGDCLSDLGDPAGIGPMLAALSDSSRLVRWRAARFLYEVGDESALPALERAVSDPEFEVRLQARLAIERIESGQGSVEPVWRQMTKGLET